MRWILKQQTISLLILAGVAIFPTRLTGPQDVQAADRSRRRLPGFGRSTRTQGAFDYATVGQQTGIDGLQALKIEGIGLVVGLHDTGSDPPPNQYRDHMMNYMKKRENPIFRPTKILASPQTSIVLLRAHIPPGARKGDMIDVEVWVPPGDTTTSLKRGRLLEAEMAENVIAGGRLRQGDRLVTVDGPVSVLENPDGDADSAMLRKGKILGQGRVLNDRDFRIVLPRNSRSARLTKTLAQRINQRFYVTDQGHRQGLATAKNDQFVEVKIPKQYRYDAHRYLSVLQRIPRSAAESFYDWAFTTLGEKLLSPTTTFESSLRLEAIGPKAIPTLTKGLGSNYEAVRFASAQALAYLGDPGGVKELKRFAEHQPSYRAYALSALVAMDHPAGRMQLTTLLHSPSTKVRYGAFRALWSLDRRDSVLNGQSMGDGEFFLHVVASTAEPIVHLARNFRREIVLFDGEQRLIPPLSLRAGEFILINASADDETVDVSMFLPTPAGVVPRHAEASYRVVDVIAKAAELGASYVDIAEMLQQASVNGNLAGQLAVNAMPEAPSLEMLNSIASRENQFFPVGAGGNATPSMFAVGGPEKKQPEIIAPPDDNAEAPKPPKKGFFGLNFFRRRAN